MVGQKRKTKDGKIVQVMDYSGGIYTCVDLSSGNSIYIAESDFVSDEKKVIKKAMSVIVEPKKQEFLQDDYEYQPKKEEKQEVLIDTIEQPKLEVIEEVVVEKKKPKKKVEKKIETKMETQIITSNIYKDKYSQLGDL